MVKGYNKIHISGFLDKKLKSVAKNICCRFPFAEMVDYFRSRKEQFAVGEYWGKLVRGGCIAYRYYADEALRTVLTGTVQEMIALQRENGDLSAVAPQRQPQGRHGSDIWERKYVLLGLLEAYRTFGMQEALACAVREAEHLADQVGFPPKTPITETGWAFEGIESSSVLDPVMQLYQLAGSQKLLDFALYIAESGFCRRANIIEQILRGTDPKDIGSNGNPKESIAKAYESMSCMEGLLLLYKAVGKEKYLRCAEMFLDKVIRQEITVLGSGGADQPYNLGPGIGEQWNYTAFEQTNPSITKMMETCVAVYYIKLCNTAYRCTGDLKYIEQIERSYFNALLGAVSPENDYFDYFMRLDGTRGGAANFAHEIGGMKISCCSANGITGLEMYPEMSVHTEGDTVFIDLFSACEYSVQTPNGLFRAQCRSDYPKTGTLSFRMSADFVGRVKLRVPAFAQNARLVRGEETKSVSAGVYAEIGGLQKGETFGLLFDIPLVPYALPGGNGKFIYEYGNLVLARDKRFDGEFDRPIACTRSFEFLPEENEEFVRMKIAGGIFVDYKSAGATWNGHSEFRTVMCPEKSEKN